METATATHFVSTPLQPDAPSPAFTQQTLEALQQNNAKILESEKQRMSAEWEAEKKIQEVSNLLFVETEAHKHDNKDSAQKLTAAQAEITHIKKKYSKVSCVCVVCVQCV